MCSMQCLGRFIRIHGFPIEDRGDMFIKLGCDLVRFRGSHAHPFMKPSCGSRCMVQRCMGRLGCVTSKIVRSTVRISRCFPCALIEIPLVMSFLSPLLSRRTFVLRGCLCASDGFRIVPLSTMFARPRLFCPSHTTHPRFTRVHFVPSTCQLVW